MIKVYETGLRITALLSCMVIMGLHAGCKNDKVSESPEKNAVYRTVFDVAAQGGLVLREKPDAKAKSIKTLKQNTTVELIKSDEKEVDVNGKKARWIYVRVLDAKKMRDGYLITIYQTGI